MNPRIRIVLAFGLLVFFVFIIWKPAVTGRVSGGESERVIVVLRAQSASAITGSAVIDDEPVSLEEMRVSTAVAQQEVLDDVNAPSLADNLLSVSSVPDVVAERTLEFVPAMVVEATPQGIAELESHPLVEAVYSNVEFDLLLAQSVPLINANDVWGVRVSGNNITGSDVSVCVIDTGIEPHVAFQSRIVNQKCFCSPNCCPNNQSTDSLATDTHSVRHGTHVSGIIAANGNYTGVAPGVGIVAVKVCTSTCGLADIFAGIDYCLQVKDQYNVVAISGSIGDNGNYQTQQGCPTYFDSAIDAAYNAGILSIFASGNNGYSNGVSYPGCSPKAVAVGATDKNDVIAGFTNRGSLLDILAPGVSITSASANNGYAVLSGTSQATPHVSGVVALLQQYANSTGKFISPVNMTQLLKSTGVQIQNWTRVDALAALQTLMPPNTPPNVSLLSPVGSQSVSNPVLLNGSALDAEDGVLSGANLIWTSNVSGGLGTGNVVLVNLSAGLHLITLTAVDSAGANSSANVSVLAITPNLAPNVSIFSPVNSSLIDSPFWFNGSAVDFEDGVLVPVWTENGSVLGSGDLVNLSLAPGNHTVILSASDSVNATSSDSISFVSRTCELDVDFNGNADIDIGDFVLLLSQFFNNSLACNVPSASYCVAELDRSANGMVDIGDIVVLLGDFGSDSIKNAQGNNC